jgi:hypothetical protein
MGFRPEPTIYNIGFEGTALDGLKVRMSCCTLGEYNEMQRAVFAGGEPDEEGNVRLTPELLQANDRIVELFLNHLVSWNLEDIAGRPVPTTREGLDLQERTMVGQLISAWQTAMVEIPKPPSSPSNNGATSEEQSLGLDSISENQSN